MVIRPTTAEDRPWIEQVFLSTNQDIKSEGLLGFIAEEEGRKVGLITWNIYDEIICEIATLNVLTPGRGIGTALLNEVKEDAPKDNCEKILIKKNEVTNDFFIKNGFRENED